MDSKFEQLANDLATHQNDLHDLKLQAQLAIETLNRVDTYLENELENLGNQKPAIAELLNSKKQLFEKFAVLYRNLNQLLENGFNLDTLIINQMHELALLVSSVSPNSPLTPAELEILGKLNDSMSIK
jgi:regulator of replication initiation timing